MNEVTEAKEVAFYYPGHLWRHSDWVKSLVLFFDGVGLLVPEYKQAEPELHDPYLAAPLRDRGLLHYLVADSTVDAEATARLATALTEIITSGGLDKLSADGTAFHEISMSRMGFYGDHDLAEMIFEELRDRGLARDSQDGVSIPLHPAVRYLILVLLSQILRSKGPHLGLELSPATDQPQVVRALTEVLALPQTASVGRVVTLDLQVVSVDLRAVPLDEVLDFRVQNQAAHRRYVRSARSFARELSLLPEAERIQALDDRQAELDDLAADLRRVARRAWRRPASFALGLAAATWKAMEHDPVGALIALSAAAVAAGGASPPEVGAYSYLFAANKAHG